MRLIDILAISIKMLRTHLLRTFLTVLAISTSISLIVVLIGLGYGIQNLTIGSIIRSQSLLSLDVSANSSNNPPLTKDTIEEIKKDNLVRAVSPVLSTEGQIEWQGKLVSNVVNAGNIQYLSMEGIKLDRGRIFNPSKPEIIISPQVISLLGVKSDQILNQEVTFNFVGTGQENDVIKLDQPLEVVGISKGDDSSAMYVPYNLLEQPSNGALTSIKVLAKDQSGVMKIQSNLINKGYTVNSLVDTLNNARRAFNWATVGLVIIALIALVVAAIGMFNTLTITLLERTREIGIMKAIGLTDATVRELFLAEAVLIGFFGGILGVIVGLIGVFIINASIARLSLHYGGTPINIFSFPHGFLLSMIIYPIILSLITGWYPAMRGAKLNPLKALRYE